MKKQFISPLAGTSISNYINLLKENKFDIDWKYVPRVLYTSLISAVAMSPFIAVERASKQQAIEATQINEAPIFIIGHWRSGTTFLHYLLCKDEHFGYLNNAQAFCPGHMFYKYFSLVKTLIHILMPDKRPMDNIEIYWDSPQEEELALGNMTTHSCYHWWAFPRKMTAYFEKYILLKDLKGNDYHEFKSVYLALLKKVTLANDGKRLLIKNPANTGRISLLLELFPDAKFIYLHRNPLEVYHSTIKLHNKLLERFSFQHFDQKTIAKNTEQFYRALIQQYEQDKQLIPPKNLIEIDFKELTKQPLETAKQIYTALQIPNFDKAAPAFQQFIHSQKNYQVDSYTALINSKKIAAQNTELSKNTPQIRRYTEAI